MPVQDRLKEIRAKIEEAGDPLASCADLRSLVVTSFPSRLAELDRVFANLPGIAVPRLARRPQGRGPTSSPPATANARLIKAQLLELIDTLEPALPPAPVPLVVPRSSRPLWKPTPWVFISSVDDGAKEYRMRARNACLQKRMLPIGMETWSAATKSPADVCRSYVRECDVMILILMHRYGSIEPNSGKSYTELEYETARAAHKDILAFELTSVVEMEPLRLDPEDLRRLQTFSATLAPQLRKKVATADQLEVAIIQALDDWRSQFDSSVG